MKKIVILAILAIFAINAMAETEKKDTSKVKTGWNFGILPSIAYDADLGFQFGALSNIYYYGDGSQYPEYIHSFYVEAAYTTKRYGLFRFFYDSKYLIPDHRLTVDVSYLPDAMCDFYGYNGYPTLYHMGWHNAKKDSSEYLSRAFYKYKRDLVRVAADIEGTISGDWKWNAGLGVLGYMIDECDIDMLNGKRQPSDQKYLDPSVQGLYELYRNWGIIKPDEANGGWHPYVRGGITFDSRDKRSNPSRGIYADAFFTYSAAFGNQTEYNNLKFNFNFRQYVPIYKDRVTFAYRIGTQNTIAGKSPFYMNTYLNTLFIQRVIYEGLGGGNSLRGIMRNRILANGFAYANVELRTKIAYFDIGKQHFYIGLNPFFDLGVVTQPYKLDETEVRTAITAYNVATGRTDKYEDYFNPSRKETYMPHSAAGIGLKVAMNENFILSVDWATALNKQDNGKMMNFYVKMGYLF
ncbi:MAG: BamA/TamA family outer membrane protein [Bacteroidales bacterium]|nr:BamA/TamA family outer membrane protein [Bacteroidales bacterium]